ncbi:MAG: hypothetical protein IIB59_02315 [Planctomycetes bacterium]|nr:hypothetical protein [Planctomycetota bacterium]
MAASRRGGTLPAPWSIMRPRAWANDFGGLPVKAEESSLREGADTQRRATMRQHLLRIEEVPTPAEVRSDCAEAVAHAGADGIEWVLPSPIACSGANDRFQPMDTSHLDDPSAAVRILAVAVRCETPIVEEGVESLAALLPWAAKLGARCVNVTIPPLQSLCGQVGFARYQDALNFAYGLLHSIRFAAEDTGVAVALEPVIGGCLLSPVELREIIDNANSWAVGLVVDADRIAAVGSVEDWLKTLTHRIHAVRLPRDGTVESTGAPPGGRFDTPVNRLLDGLCYDRVVVLPMRERARSRGDG